jgi:hypothetical protein
MQTPTYTPTNATPCFSYLFVHFVGERETPTTSENPNPLKLAPTTTKSSRRSEETLKPIIPIPHQLRNLIQQLLQIIIRDLIRQAGNQGLCFFGRITTQAPYTASISISLFLFLVHSPKPLHPRGLVTLKEKGRRRKETNQVAPSRISRDLYVRRVTVLRLRRFLSA